MSDEEDETTAPESEPVDPAPEKAERPAIVESGRQELARRVRSKIKRLDGKSKRYLN
jgi:hypothetical protein